MNSLVPEPSHPNSPTVADLAARPWRLFAVEIEGFGSSLVSAPTRSAAMYDRYLAFSDPWPCTFGEFLKIAKVRSAEAPTDDGYGYIRRAYGVDLKIGQRVELQNEGRAYNGRQGVVLYPGRSTAHVHVLLDGEKHRSVVHPDSIKAAA